MADYQPKDIRNIAFLGHGSEGKTTLTESMLYAAGHIDRQGRVEDGNTVSDFDPEEIKRSISINTSVAPVEWKGTKVNIIDVPGYFDFVGEMMGPVRVTQTVGIVINAVNGITVGAEKAWNMAEKNGLSRMFIVNQMDRENANFDKVLERLRETYGGSVVPLLVPIGAGANFRGVVNVLEGTAFEGANKTLKSIDVPADMTARLKDDEMVITEASAEAIDELLEKFFSEGELSHDEVLEGFRAGMKSGKIVPVVCCSAVTGVGVAPLLDIMKSYLNWPSGTVAEGVNPKNNEPARRKCVNEEPFSAFVFKTIADPFVGKLSLVRVMSGVLTPATALYNANDEKAEKSGGLFMLRGKKQSAAQQLNAGDIGALSKLQFTSTGDTLCDAAAPIRYPELVYPLGNFSKAVYAAKQ